MLRRFYYSLYRIFIKTIIKPLKRFNEKELNSELWAISRKQALSSWEVFVSYVLHKRLLPGTLKLVLR